MIGDQVIDRIHASRVVVSAGGHLHGRGLSGKGQEPVPARVSGEINENVDRVRADSLGQLLVIVSKRLAPAVGLGTKALGEVVWARDPRVAKQLEAPSVMMCDDRRKEPADGMVTEVR